LGGKPNVGLEVNERKAGVRRCVFSLAQPGAACYASDSSTERKVQYLVGFLGCYLFIWGEESCFEQCLVEEGVRADRQLD